MVRSMLLRGFDRQCVDKIDAYMQKVRNTEGLGIYMAQRVWTPFDGNISLKPAGV